jgi:DNA-binding NarL/FixJ family response regulator
MLMELYVALLIDANLTFLQSVSRFLADHAPNQIEVGGTVGNSADALALAASLRPAVVLLGLASSAQPGLQLLPQLRALLPHSGIIVLSVLEVNGYRQMALTRGADAFVLKDDLPVTLLPTIMDVMRDRKTD